MSSPETTSLPFGFNRNTSVSDLTELLGTLAVHLDVPLVHANHRDVRELMDYDTARKVKLIGSGCELHSIHSFSSTVGGRLVTKFNFSSLYTADGRLTRGHVTHREIPAPPQHSSAYGFSVLHELSDPDYLELAATLILIDSIDVVA